MLNDVVDLLPANKSLHQGPKLIFDTLWLRVTLICDFFPENTGASSKVNLWVRFGLL